MRLLLLLILIVLSATPSRAKDGPPVESRQQFLTRLNDLDQVAFGYHFHCISNKQMPDPKFMRILEMVSNDLLNELMRLHPESSPGDLKRQVAERRYNIQRDLESYYYKNGCQSDGARVASKHYEEFRVLSIADVKRFIDERSVAR